VIPGPVAAVLDGAAPLPAGRPLVLLPLPGLLALELELLGLELLGLALPLALALALVSASTRGPR